MSRAENPSYAYKPGSSSSAQIKKGGGTLGRILITASSSGVIDVYDSLTATGTKIIDTFSVAAKDNIEFPVEFQNGLYVSIASGTATYSVAYT